jgi:hypothetical protein
MAQTKFYLDEMQGEQIIKNNKTKEIVTCVYAAPVPVQNSIGQITMQQRACSSACIFFHYNEPSNEVRFACNGAIMKFSKLNLIK